jgi:hypothetical protein
MLYYKTNAVAISPQSNYIDRIAAAAGEASAYFCGQKF